MADIVTGEAVVLDIRPARLPTRALAFGLDALIQLTLLYSLGLLIVGAAVVADPPLVIGISLVTYVGVIVGYPVLCETLWRGRTIGKLALGLRVVSEDGGPERFRQAVVRGLAGFVEIWAFLGTAAIIASLLSWQGKRLGDVFAGTLVVSERVPVRGRQLPSMPPGLAAWAQGLELSHLPDDVALSARQYVSRYFELAPDVRDEMGIRIAATVSAHVSPEAPQGTHPLAYLSAVLAERRRREEWRLQARRHRDAPQHRSPGRPAVGPTPGPGPAPGPYGPPAAPRPPPHRPHAPPGGFAPPS